MEKYRKANFINKFSNLFHAVPAVMLHAPGRINIIGEHTDYNGGFVLPAAIDKGIDLAVSKRNDGEIHLFAEEFGDFYKVALEEIKPVKDWPDYILGVVDQLRQRNSPVTGFNLLLKGNIPIGAGLSSSAAVECATVFALDQLFDFSLTRLQMVKIAQAAEHSYPGVLCGIMDQFASMFGKKDQVIRLDCRSLDYTYIPFTLNGYTLLLLNSNIKHSLASSGYNERRQQCEQGVAWVKESIPAVSSLRDVTLQMLNELVMPKDALIYKRCRYVVEENVRLDTACSDLKAGDLAALGKRMFATHEGLSKQYEVSCRELDLLIDLVKNDRDVAGARMVGGGFGGCSLNLVKEEAADRVINETSKKYLEKTGLYCSHYIVSIENGTSLL